MWQNTIWTLPILVFLPAIGIMILNALMTTRAHGSRQTKPAAPSKRPPSSQAISVIKETEEQ